MLYHILYWISVCLCIYKSVLYHIIDYFVFRRSCIQIFWLVGLSTPIVEGLINFKDFGCVSYKSLLTYCCVFYFLNGKGHFKQLTQANFQQAVTTCYLDPKCDIAEHVCFVGFWIENNSLIGLSIYQQIFAHDSLVIESW